MPFLAYLYGPVCFIVIGNTVDRRITTQMMQNDIKMISSETFFLQMADGWKMGT